jgi:hypothetical protein
LLLRLLLLFKGRVRVGAPAFRVALRQEQAAEVEAENAQAVAARRKPHPQNIYALYLII